MKEINDDQIRVLGENPDEKEKAENREQRTDNREAISQSQQPSRAKPLKPSAIANSHRERSPLPSSFMRLWVQFLGWAVLVLLLSLLLFRTEDTPPQPLPSDPNVSHLQGDPSAICQQPSQGAALQPLNPSTTKLLNQTGRSPHTLSRLTHTPLDGFTEIFDQTSGEIPLRLYIPHLAELTLHIGPLDREDRTIIYAACAADIRADNGGIVGAFVLRGEPRAWGLSKKGYCASIGGKVSIGVADNSPLFEQATHEGGYFFRQYPLVGDRRVVDNRPPGTSIRRALCDRGGEIFMAESLTQITLHDFAQALVDLGVDQAIYLMGSTAYGWAIDAAGDLHEFGKDFYYCGEQPMPKNLNYIVWRKK